MDSAIKTSRGWNYYPISDDHITETDMDDYVCDHYFDNNSNGVDHILDFIENRLIAKDRILTYASVYVKDKFDANSL